MVIKKMPKRQIIELNRLKLTCRDMHACMQTADCVIFVCELFEKYPTVCINILYAIYI